MKDDKKRTARGRKKGPDKVKTSVMIPVPLDKRLKARLLRNQNRTERITLDLVRFHAVLDAGMKTLHGKFSSEEIAILVKRAVAQLIGSQNIHFLLAGGLEALAYNPVFDIEDEDPDTGVNLMDLAKKISGLDILERLALLDTLERFRELPGKNALEAIEAAFNPLENNPRL